jgi:hypothetical protein
VNLQPALAALLLTSCATQAEELPLAANFLRLQSWVAVDPVAGSARGHLRWLYVADDPAVTAEPRPFCENWELLELSAAASPDPACPSCLVEWTGTASIEAEEGNCADAAWDPRPMTLAFAPLPGSDVDAAELADAGFVFAAYSRWSPDLGDTQGYQGLFAAEPEQWTAEDAPLGTSPDPSGEYHLFCRYYWDLR